MDLRVDTVAPGWSRTFPVPPSKSMHQRALALGALARGPATLVFADDARPPGEDVQRCAAAFARLGTWRGESLGDSKASLTLDLGESGTALRFAVALAALRPAGARTLVRARPVLLRRPHGPLLRALVALGGSVKRRSSGAIRVVAGGLRHGGRVTIDMRRSSQYASALALIAPRLGGLTLDLRGASTSRAYLDLTLAMLREAQVPVEAGATRVVIGAADPMAPTLRVEADASAAACWWTAATLTGGRAYVQGLDAAGPQADLAILPILESYGARVERDAGWISVQGPSSLAAGGTHDLTASPDLIFLVGALGACAPGTTRITGVAHTRAKESDRVAVLAEGLGALGVPVTVSPDHALAIEGGSPRGGLVRLAGDHRAAFGFGVLGLAVPGVELRGAAAASKSQPGFLADLAALGREGSNSQV